MRSLLRTPAFIVALVLAPACVHERAQVSPEATLNAFAQALTAGDEKRAYSLMSEGYRERVSLGEFTRQVRDNRKEAEQLAAALGKRASQKSYVEVQLADGSAVLLTKKGEDYRIETPVADFYSQATPRAALESFVRAVERSRWDIVFELMPNADRQGLEVATLGKNLESQIEELTRIVALLKSSREYPIEIVGERATMPYGESFTARFVREDARWKIEDPE
jgi:hypothetical protein